MIAQLNDITITISGDTLDSAAWAFIGFVYGVTLVLLVDVFAGRKKKVRVAGR
jgi:hypothetical protein